ncbi:MAG: ComF family protein [Crocinitomicaceae bacterium]
MRETFYKKLTHKIVEAKESLVHLLFPDLCLVCEREIPQNQQKICSFCETELPFTHFTQSNDKSPLEQLFWGRVRIEHVYSWLTYQRETSTQTLLHQIKYKDKPQLAQTMGEKLGRQLEHFDWIKEVEAFIPVPIHPKKRFIRGYNQSEELVKGLTSVLNIPMDTDFIQRSLHTESQTKKGRFGRWDNIDGAFRRTNANKTYQHIAIVDDVITTGATLERIVQQIHEKNPDLRVSLISLAFAQ